MVGDATTLSTRGACSGLSRVACPARAKVASEDESEFDEEEGLNPYAEEFKPVGIR